MTELKDPEVLVSPSRIAGFAPLMGEPRDLLQVSDLTVRFFTYDGVLKALDGVNFTIKEREIFGIVGETGCGKSVTAKAVLRLIPDPPGRITHGTVLFGGINLLDNIEAEARIRITDKGRAKIRRKRRIAKRMEALMRTIRGNEISMIFQEPSAALNPVLTVEDQVGETFLSHQLTEICEGIERTQETSGAQKRYFARLKEREGAFDEFRKTFGALSAHRALQNAAEAVGDTSAATSERGALEDIERQLRRLTLRARKNDFLLDFWKWLWLFTAPLGAVRGAISGAAAAGAAPLADQQNIFLGSIIISTVLWLVGGAVGGRILSRVRKAQLEKPIRAEVRRRVIAMLKAVNIADPEKKAEAFPFELSGGMQQRVMIAMALACQPRLLLADEPTTALDVTIQAQILTLIRELREKFGSSIMLITHDLGVVAETCDRVGVMYAGVMAEIGTAGQTFNEPKHPYTVGLLRSIPESFARTGKLAIIPGSVPSLLKPPEGCRFHPRCPFAADICKSQVPALAEVAPGHRVACHLYDHPEAFPAPTVAQRDQGLDAVWEEVVKA